MLGNGFTVSVIEHILKNMDIWLLSIFVRLFLSYESLMFSGFDNKNIFFIFVRELETNLIFIAFLYWRYIIWRDSLGIYLLDK
jgi:hypothetical protein